MEKRLVANNISRYKVVKKDWFAYNPMRLNIGSISRWSGYEPVLVSPDYIVFRCSNDSDQKIDPNYLDHFRYSDQWDRFVTLSGDGSVRVRIYFRDLAALRLILPPIDEQQKIAECLSSLDGLIAAEGRKLEALKAHKKGLMQQLFPQPGQTQPRLRSPEFRDKGEWSYEELSELVDVIDGDRGTNYPKADEFSDSGFCIFLNAKNVTKNGFKFEELQFITKSKDELLRKGKLKRKDIILTTRGSVGHFAYFTKDVPYENMRINSGMVILRVKSKEIDPDYLYAFSNSAPLTMHIEDISFGNAQQQLTVAGIKKLPIYYPELAEQQRIADCLTALDTRIAAQAAKIETLKQHKRGLMQQLFPAPEGQE